MKKDLSFLKTVMLINTYEIIFCVSTTINHECTKYRGVTVAEYSFVRNGINFIFAGALLCIYRVGPIEGLNRSNIKIFLLRSVIGNLGYFTFTLVYKLLPLGIGSTLVSSNTLIVTLLSFVWLGDRASCVEISAIFVSFFGIVMMGLSQ